MKEDKKLTLIEHLDELRQRLIKSVIILVATTLISFLFAKQIFRILLFPAGDLQPVFIEVTEMLSTYIRVALLGGLVLAMPILIYQVIGFVSPGLTSRERKSLYWMLPAITMCFLGGIVFSYFIILPPALRFLLGIGEGIAVPQIKIGSYVSMVTRLIFWVGVAFETPVMMFFLARLRLVTPKLLAKFRRHAIVVAFLLGALITPTIDPVNQSLVAVPIIILYEVGILLAKLAWRGQKEALKERD